MVDISLMLVKICIFWNHKKNALPNKGERCGYDISFGEIIQQPLLVRLSFLVLALYFLGISFACELGAELAALGSLAVLLTYFLSVSAGLGLIWSFCHRYHLHDY